MLVDLAWEMGMVEKEQKGSRCRKVLFGQCFDDLPPHTSS
jgi:phage anti-repressor protein